MSKDIKNVGDLYTGESTVKRDPSIDLASLVKKAKPQEEKSVNSSNLSGPSIEKTLSPLEQMRREQEKNGSGLVVSNEELEKGKEKTNFANIAYNEDRMKGVHEKMDELDDMLEKRKAIIPIKHPQPNTPEYSEMMREIGAVKFKDDGTAYIDLRDENEKPITPEYIRLRTKDDPEYDEKLKDNIPVQNPENEENPVTEEDEKEEEKFIV